jgi:hypothetical protein
MEQALWQGKLPDRMLELNIYSTTEKVALSNNYKLAYDFLLNLIQNFAFSK